jgi:hypothetical protein
VRVVLLSENIVIKNELIGKPVQRARIFKSVYGRSDGENHPTAFSRDRCANIMLRPEGEASAIREVEFIESRLSGRLIRPLETAR